MKLLVVRHAIAMEKDEYQVEARARGLAGDATGGGPDDAGAAGGDAADADDDYRPLTLDGMRRFRRAAKGLRALIAHPGIIISSPLTRAMQTAEILRKTAWPDLDIAVCEDLRPGSDPAALVAWINDVPATRHAPSDAAGAIVTVVGHEPHLSSMVSWFLTGNAKAHLELKKGGACLLDFSGALARSKGNLLWLLPPRVLKELR